MAVENKQVKERSLALTSNSNVAKYLRLSAERIMKNVSRKELIEDATLLFLGECKTVFRRSSRLFEMLKGTAQVKARASADLHAGMAASQAIELMGAGDEDVLDATVDLADDTEAMKCIGMAALHIQGCGKDRRKIASVLSWLLAAWTLAGLQNGPGVFHANAKAA
jgi:hypothetical protein